MGLSEYERAALRRVDADLSRQDPRLAWQLAALAAEARVSRRPPRAIVAAAAATLAAAAFVLGVLFAVGRPACDAAGDARAAVIAAPGVPGGSRPASPTRC